MASTQNEVELFVATLDLEESQRLGYLERVCGENLELRDRLNRYLLAHDRSSGPLDERPAEITSALADWVANCRLGDWIGPYKLLEQIGVGGMGVVFMAQQRDPIRRTVALKIIKPGMDSEQVVARFEAERQALALMNHPNIAKVLDAGTTQTGLPYFVMELVKGIPVTAYCDEHRLDTRQRLELFITICQAVQHAHQKGIIHRDLKPSNVLVELHDVRSVPKIIDFGVAKATSQPLTEHSLHTGFSQMIGTPMYMSPEQTQLSGLDVDTRSDVYSLGVVLYELLTGDTPFDADTLRQAGFDEVRRIIREVEPPRPSHRVNTLAAQNSSTVDERSLLDRRKLTTLIRGELDWIVMTALEKDRTRRYETASGLAADVQRYLNDEAVQACPPSVRYRLQKYTRRHKGLISAVALLTLTLVSSTAISTWFAIAANDARTTADIRLQQSEKDYERSLAAVDLMVEQLRSEEFFQNDQMKSARDALLNKALGFYREIVADHSSDTQSMLHQAEAYQNAIEIHKLMGDKPQARQASQEELKILDPLVEQYPDRQDIRLALSNALLRRAWMSKGEDKVQLLERSISINQALLNTVTDAPTVNKAKGHLANACRTLSGVLTKSDPERAYDLAQKAILLSSNLPEDRNILAASWTRMGKVQAARQELDDSETAMREGVKFAEEYLVLNPNDRVARQQMHLCLKSLSTALESRGKSSEAEGAQSQAASFAIQLTDEFSDSVLVSAWEKNVQFADLEELEEFLTSRLSISRMEILQRLVTSHRNVSMMVELVQKLIESGRFFEAERLSEDILKQLGAHLGVTTKVNPWVHRHYSALKIARISRLLAQEQYDEAQQVLDRLNPGLSGDFDAQAHLDRARGNNAKALQSLNSAIGLSPKAVPLLTNRGDLFQELERYQDAIDDYSTALTIDPKQWHIMKRRATARFRLNQFEAALSDFENAIEGGFEDLSLISWIPGEQIAACPNAEFRSGMRRLADRTVELNGRSLEALIRHTHLLMELGERQAARANLVELLAHEDSGYYPHYLFAMLALDAKDLPLYRQHCSELVDRYVESQDGEACYFSAWTCSIVPEALEDYGAVLAQSGALLNARPHNGRYLTALGALQMRAGEYENSRETLWQAVAVLDDGSMVYVRFFQAMNEVHFGRKQEAREFLESANRLAEREFTRKTSRPSWNRRLTIELLQRETNALLNITTVND